MARRKVSLSPVSLADGDVTDSGVSGGKDRNEEEIEEDGDGRPQKKLVKKTVVKVASKSKKQPKTQTAAMWQMVQSIEQCSSQQEKNSDLRLATMLE